MRKYASYKGKRQLPKQLDLSRRTLLVAGPLPIGTEKSFPKLYKGTSKSPANTTA